VWGATFGDDSNSVMCELVQMGVVRAPAFVLCFCTECRARARNGTGVSTVSVLHVSYVCCGPTQLGWLKYVRNSTEQYGTIRKYGNLVVFAQVMFGLLYL
jgi:hypothetical protein